MNVRRSDGALLEQVVYRPYGDAVSPVGGQTGTPPSFGFTGQRFEASAGIYDYGARWYDVRLGRFLQPDVVVPEPFDPQSLNRYSYVRNDPTNRVDPSGSTDISSFGGTIEDSYASYSASLERELALRDASRESGYFPAGDFSISPSERGISLLPFAMSRQNQAPAPGSQPGVEYLRGILGPQLSQALFGGQRSQGGQSDGGILTAARNATDFGLRSGLFVAGNFRVVGVLGVTVDVDIASFNPDLVDPRDHKFTSGFEISAEVAGFPFGVELFKREINISEVASPLRDLFNQPSRSGPILPTQVRGGGPNFPGRVGRLEGGIGALAGVQGSFDVRRFFREAFGQ